MSKNRFVPLCIVAGSAMFVLAGIVVLVASASWALATNF